MFMWMCIGCEQLLLVLSFLPCFSYPLCSLSFVNNRYLISEPFDGPLSLSHDQSLNISETLRVEYNVTCPTTLQRKKFGQLAERLNSVILMPLRRPICFCGSEAVFIRKHSSESERISFRGRPRQRHDIHAM